MVWQKSLCFFNVCECFQQLFQVLTLSQVTIGQVSIGHIVNLASNDVQRFDMVRPRDVRLLYFKKKFFLGFYLCQHVLDSSGSPCARHISHCSRSGLASCFASPNHRVSSPCADITG